MTTRITRVVTRAGDGGRTRLAGGQEVDKDDVRVEAYGTVDELTAFVGQARVAARQAGDAEIEAVLASLTNDLFSVGGDLATPEGSGFVPYRVGDADLAELEALCERFNEGLPPLRDFVLPGGSELSTALHVARTVCRRAERRVVALKRADPTIGDGCLKWLNRLSDLLFILSRAVAHRSGEAEPTWTKKG
jgi:cob(I)alamin adenosyltransferase